MATRRVDERRADRDRSVVGRGFHVRDAGCVASYSRVQSGPTDGRVLSPYVCPHPQPFDGDNMNQSFQAAHSQHPAERAGATPSARAPGRLRLIGAAVVLAALSSHALADITFYEDPDFRGRSIGAQSPVRDLGSMGFSDRASSVEVRGERWEVCVDNRFGGSCRVLRPGSYPSLASMGLDDRIRSAKPLQGGDRVDDARYSPEPQPNYSRRGGETLYQAQVVSVRAVMGDSQQRCWIEQEQVRNRPNVGGAVVGGVLGGILGHQFGGGSGRDVATAAGAVGGAVVGSNVNRNETRNVQRCGDAQNQGNPAYWDVRYRFRGQEHTVQTQQAPGATITVNGRGEPRI